MRPAAFVATALGCFVLGVILGTAQIPLAWIAKHWKNPPRFSL
jgi:hypothetical protein